jgi:hypothetical protein
MLEAAFATRRLLALALGLSWALVPTAARAADLQPLHQRIDQSLAAGQSGELKQKVGLASDAEFLRRVTLDLTGTIPTAAQARAFLQDTSPSKRQAQIDRLLASPEHARYLAAVFDVQLMERRPDKHVPRAAWLEFLRTAVAANKPWDELTREILSSDGVDPAHRPAAKFFLDRDGEPNLLTRDVSRLFLGMNLQCAQCHDHPRVEEYKQDYYYGLYAFLSRSFVFNDPALKQVVLAEKADGDVTFQSVFDKAKVTRSTGPHVPYGPALKEPVLAKGTEYIVAPAKNVRPVPRFSRRGLLGPSLARADNVPFKRNGANRLWALLLGRGLVHPLDMDHPANPPSYPDLLNLLAEDFAARKFEVRSFLRELALSQAYQRSSEPPPGVAVEDLPLFAVARLKPLTPEQLAGALMQATGLADAERTALGKQLTEPALYARLAGQALPIVKAFAGPPGTTPSFDPRVDQTLFLENGSVIRAWLAPRPGNLVDRLSHLSTPDAQAEELYLSVFTRLPGPEERHDVGTYLAARLADRSAALQELVWAMLTSAEFRFNH